MKLMIDILRSEYDYYVMKSKNNYAMRMAESVIAHGTPIEYCSDCISREEAERPFDMVQQDDLAMSYDNIAKYLSRLPSVYPNPRAGKWIYYQRDSENGEYRCSMCGNPSGYPTKYCDNCGAKMEMQDALDCPSERSVARRLSDDDGNISCSRCGSGNCYDDYCGNCGAKMKEV